MTEPKITLKSQTDRVMNSVSFWVEKYDSGGITLDVMYANLRQVVNCFLADEYDRGFEDGVNAIEDEEGEEIIIIEPEEDSDDN